MNLSLSEPHHVPRDQGFLVAGLEEGNLLLGGKVQRVSSLSCFRPKNPTHLKDFAPHQLDKDYLVRVAVGMPSLTNLFGVGGGVI